MKEFNSEQVKASLTEMGIPYTDADAPENLKEMITAFGYESMGIMTDLAHTDTIDAETGVVVRNVNHDVDDGIYIFTVLHSGQAGFIVVEPSTISREPLIRKVTGDIISAVTGIDMPPLMPFDMVEITAHMIAGTFMKMMMESCRIPKEYEKAFLHLYMPKFLANVGLYFIGATNKDGSPMVYEEIANMEPMMIWRSIQKGAAGDESESTGGAAGKDADSAETKEE